MTCRRNICNVSFSLWKINYSTYQHTWVCTGKIILKILRFQTILSIWYTGQYHQWCFQIYNCWQFQLHFSVVHISSYHMKGNSVVVCLRNFVVALPCAWLSGVISNIQPDLTNVSPVILHVIYQQFMTVRCRHDWRPQDLVTYRTFIH